MARNAAAGHPHALHSAWAGAVHRINAHHRSIG
jgi:hypothetical protein